MARKEKVNRLFQRIKTFYTESGAQCCLQGLTPEMIKQYKTSPKLRAKGGETRHLVPFAFKLATEFDAHYQTVFSNTVQSMLSYLLGFYLCMDKVPFDPGEASTLCRKCCILYKSLSTEATKADASRWKLKPQNAHVL